MESNSSISTSTLPMYSGFLDYFEVDDQFQNVTSSIYNSSLFSNSTSSNVDWFRTSDWAMFAYIAIAVIALLGNSLGLAVFHTSSSTRISSSGTSNTAGSSSSSSSSSSSISSHVLLFNQSAVDAVTGAACMLWIVGDRWLTVEILAKYGLAEIYCQVA